MTAIWKPLERDQWLYCLRVGLAAPLAYLLAHGTDPAGVLYAVLGACLVTGETVGEGIGISRDRVIGSILGVVIAVPVSAVGDTSVWTVTLACITAGIAGLATGRSAAARIAITVAAVSVLMHPDDTAHYGLFRITNTMLGVAVAVAVSYAFWPLIGHTAPRRVICRVLAASADLFQTIAASSRTDLRRRRQQTLFHALAAIPKTRKDAEQDPFLRRHSMVTVETMGLLAEVGVHVLAASAAVARIKPADRELPWWNALTEGLNSTARQLLSVRAQVDRRPAQGDIPQVPATDWLEAVVAGPFGTARLHESVMGILYDLHTVQDRLDDLAKSAREWAAAGEPGELP